MTGDRATVALACCFWQPGLAWTWITFGTNWRGWSEKHLSEPDCSKHFLNSLWEEGSWASAHPWWPLTLKCLLVMKLQSLGHRKGWCKQKLALHFTANVGSVKDQPVSYDEECFTLRMLESHPSSQESLFHFESAVETHLWLSFIRTCPRCSAEIFAHRIPFALTFQSWKPLLGVVMYICIYLEMNVVSDTKMPSKWHVKDNIKQFPILHSEFPISLYPLFQKRGKSPSPTDYRVNSQS